MVYCENDVVDNNYYWLCSMCNHSSSTMKQRETVCEAWSWTGSDTIKHNSTIIMCAMQSYNSGWMMMFMIDTNNNNKKWE